MKFLVTGGAGYIGSITNAYIRSLGHETVIFDSLVNGHKEATKDTPLVIGDLCVKHEIEKVFQDNRFDAVIHFAAFALAGESMERPYDYFKNNYNGTLNLLEAMRKYDCKTLVFSSTCAVYGFPEHLPVTEQSPIHPMSIYAQSKWHCEELITWYEKQYGIKHAKLRYFNACGDMPDGSLGEDHAPETHIIPVAMKAIVSGKPFSIYGNNYQTPDGTCVRDYIHVLDLADAHVKAVSTIASKGQSLIVNLGVGKGYSNLEVLKAIEKVTGKTLALEWKDRRAGDPDAIYADNAKAKSVLGWEPKYQTIESIIETAWAWHEKHPNGYKK